MYLHNRNIEYTFSRTKPLYDTKGLVAERQRHDRGSCCTVASVFSATFSPAVSQVYQLHIAQHKVRAATPHPTNSVPLQAEDFVLNEVLRVHVEHEHYIADASSK